MDAKDILGLLKTPFSLTQERKSRPQKDSQRKLDGISREVYALTGGLTPLMLSLDVSQLKRIPLRTRRHDVHKRSIKSNG